MDRFALLTRESSNRVYADRAPVLLQAELAALAGALHTTVDGIESCEFGTVPYVVFTAGELDEHDRFIVSNLSSVRALFELRDDGAFIPLEMAPLTRFDDDLISIQRYPGKTNEQFTHLLVNLTVAASASAHGRTDGGPIQLLDPVAGRGTTLNRALMYGFDAHGIERSDSDVDQYRLFIESYLKDHRIKHKIQREQVRKGKLAGTFGFTAAIRGEQSVRLVRGHSAQTRELFPGKKFDAIVGDLPYGVQHRAAGAKSSHRSSEELLVESAPGWRAALHPGAALGLAWNRKTMSRNTVIEILEANRFTIVEHPRSFQHIVDRSITRDLLVATR